MRKLFLSIFTALLALGFVGCEYDDSGLWNEVNSLKDRVLTLEQLCQQMNTNISAMQAIVNALQTQDYITSVTPISQGGKTIGYTITFAKGDPITIYHGQDGKDGQDGADGKDGENGKDGQDGADGKDGYTPVIGIEKADDGKYYWTLDGEWLTDKEGNKIPATGKDGKDGADGKDGENGKDGQDGKDGADGKDGQDGKDGADGKDGENGKDGQDGKDGADGKDGITPELDIRGGYWYVSYDGGESWERLGRATGYDGSDGKDGQNGAQGPQGPKGDKGDKGDAFFSSVDVSNDDYVIFVLENGTTFEIPKYKAFKVELDTPSANYVEVGTGKDDVTIDYTVTGCTNPTVLVISDLEAKASNGTITVKAPTSKTGLDDVETVTLMASNGQTTVLASVDITVAEAYVETWNEFITAIGDNKSTIVLGANISNSTNNSYTINTDVMIDLNGKTLEITDPTKRINIGNKNDINAPKPNVTIKNGNLHSKVYAQTGNVELYDITFGGTIAYADDAQGVISVGSANLLAERCNMKNVSKSGNTKPRTFCPEGRSSGYLKLRDCDFKNTNLDRPYINTLNNNATLEITNCSLYSMASNIVLGASFVWSNMNLNLTGCTGGFTFNISRASTSLTDDEIAIYRAIKQNNSGSMRFIFSDGEKNNL